MRKNVYLTAFTFLTLSLCSTVKSKAQNNGSWQPLWLSTTNVFKGIEGFYQLSACNGTEMVMVKFINHNNYKVRAGWKDLVINNSGQQIPSSAMQDSVTIPASGQMEGSCTGSPKLYTKLSNFGITPSDFKGFFCSGFDYRIIQ